MKPEQRLWLHLRRVMGASWNAQRHEDKYSPDIPDVSYSCRGQNGWVELKVIDHWPVSYLPLTIPESYFTPGQRAWLTKHGKHGNGHCYLFARVGSDFMLARWDQLPKLGVWTRQDWLWFAHGFWQKRLVPAALAERLSNSALGRLTPANSV